MNEEGKTLFSKGLTTCTTNAVFLAAIVLFVPRCQLPCSAVQGGLSPEELCTQRALYLVLEGRKYVLIL